MIAMTFVSCKLLAFSKLTKSEVVWTLILYMSIYTTYIYTIIYNTNIIKSEPTAVERIHRVITEKWQL